jgi:multimeric flavodoxin WrbA
MRSRLYLHDLPPDLALRALPPENDRTRLFAALPEASGCKGCFGCWVRTPGACVLKDRYRRFAAEVSRHGELVIVTRLVWGGYSPPVKRVVDRSLAHLLPFFTLREGHMRHLFRGSAGFRLTAVFYGAQGDREAMDLAERLVRANASNFGASAWEAKFIQGDPEPPLP